MALDLTPLEYQQVKKKKFAGTSTPKEVNLITNPEVNNATTTRETSVRDNNIVESFNGQADGLPGMLQQDWSNEYAHTDGTPLYAPGISVNPTPLTGGLIGILP